LTQIEVELKVLLKSQFEVELNEFLQEKVDSELFEGVDEMDQARFIGSFFRWVRNLFNEKKEPELPSVIKSSLANDDSREVESPLMDEQKSKPIPPKADALPEAEELLASHEELNLSGNPMSNEAKK
jgi:hypothetical protein